MAVSLQKLGLRNNDTVREIGCGTGKVTGFIDACYLIRPWLQGIHSSSRHRIS